MKRRNAGPGFFYVHQYFFRTDWRLVNTRSNNLCRFFPMMISYIIDGSTSQFLNGEIELILDILQSKTNNNGGDERIHYQLTLFSLCTLLSKKNTQLVVAKGSIISGHCLYCALCCPKAWLKAQKSGSSKLDAIRNKSESKSPSVKCLS